MTTLKTKLPKPSLSRKKTVTLQGRDVLILFRKVKGAKGLRIQISSAQKITVTGSRWTSFTALETFFSGQMKWVAEKLTHFQKFPNATIKLTPANYKAKKESARKLVNEKLQFWNQYYGFTWGTVAIRNQSTRWGSCSSKKTLSFHAGIIDLPENLQDYLIVHELCHLSAMHHGPQFWNLVEKAIPEGKKRDIGLKKYSKNATV